MNNIKYKHTTELHNLKSPNAVVPIINSLFKPKSVVDFGCGLGTWLKVFKDSGINKVLGLDGDWIDTTKFETSVIDNFKEVDLEKEIKLKEKFDLAISLEVAEHLHKESANIFIQNLINASDIIIFSAAVPMQGGQNHINEQPLSYWIKLFSEYGYKFNDIIRGRIWNMENVFWWYKQNMVVFSKNELNITPVYPVDILHPESRHKKSTI